MLMSIAVATRAEIRGHGENGWTAERTYGEDDHKGELRHRWVNPRRRTLMAQDGYTVGVPAPRSFKAPRSITSLLSPQTMNWKGPGNSPSVKCEVQGPQKGPALAQQAAQQDHISHDAQTMHRKLRGPEVSARTCWRQSIHLSQVCCE